MIPSSLRSPVKAARSGCSVTNTSSKLFRSFVLIGFVGLFFIHQRQGYHLSLSSFQERAPGDSYTKHSRLGMPKQAVIGGGDVNSDGNGPQLDFAVVGFEKTGTTFLLEVLGNHPEITMPEKHSEDSFKICVKKQEGKEILKQWIQKQQQEHLLQQSEMSTATASSKKRTKYGVKCSQMIRKPLGIDNFADVSTAKLIVGLRHPVEWFQSNYNYRVMLHHKEKSKSTIPSPHKLTNPNEDWHGVSTVAAQFDKYLKQLGKTSLEREELVELLQTLSDANFRINHNPLKVFIYTIEQLEDVNNARRRIFEMDLQHFLGLETPFYDFSSQAKSNVNTVTYPEYIDICQPEYNSIRNMLVMEGKKSSEWIMDRFLLSEDVVVSNGDYFREKLRSWGEDPCSTVPRETMKGKI